MKNERSKSKSKIKKGQSNADNVSKKSRVKKQASGALSNKGGGDDNKSVKAESVVAAQPVE